MKNKTTKSKALFMIAMLLMSNFIFAVMLSENVMAEDYSVATSQKLTEEYKKPKTWQNLKTFNNNIRTNDPLYWNKNGDKLLKAESNIDLKIRQGKPILSSDAESIAQAEAHYSAQIKEAYPYASAKDYDGIIGETAANAPKTYAAQHPAPQPTPKEPAPTATSEEKAASKEEPKAGEPKPATAPTEKVAKDSYAVEIAAGGKPLTSGPLDIIKTLVSKDREITYVKAVNGVDTKITAKVSGFQVLVQQCKNEIIACIATVMAHGFTVGNVADMIFDSKEDRFGTANPEEALGGTKNCEKCNEDKFLPCTASRCDAIGWCDHSTEEKGEVLCVPKECSKGDVRINKITASWPGETAGKTSWTAYSKSSSYSGDKNILKLDRKAPNKLISFTLNIETDMYSKCRYGIDNEGKDKGYDDIRNDKNIIGDGSWAKLHEEEIALPAEIQRGQEHTIYIECENICGSKREAGFNDYRVEFEIEETPEIDPPSIIHPIDPDDSYFYPATLNEAVVTIPLSENGYCKYSTSTGSEQLSTGWNNMTVMDGAHPEYSSGNVSVKKAECKYNQECENTKLKNCGKCFITLDLTKGYDEINWSTVEYENLRGLDPEIASRAALQMELEGTSKMYMLNLRCADLGRNGVANHDDTTSANDDNIMDEEDTYLYMFKTADPYILDVIKPEESKDYDEKNIPIEANTTRTTKCRYMIDNQTSFDDMIKINDDKMAKSHKIEISGLGLTAGSHTLRLACRDAVTLQIEKDVEFNLVADITSPKIVRAYHAADIEDLLTIKTNEEALECKYSTDKETGCNYEFEWDDTKGVHGMQASDISNTEYATVWDSSKTFYIKCKDWKGLVPEKARCSENGIIQPYSVIEED